MLIRETRRSRYTSAILSSIWMPLIRRRRKGHQLLRISREVQSLGSLDITRPAQKAARLRRILRFASAVWNRLGLKQPLNAKPQRRLALIWSSLNRKALTQFSLTPWCTTTTQIKWPLGIEWCAELSYLRTTRRRSPCTTCSEASTKRMNTFLKWCRISLSGANCQEMVPTSNKRVQSSVS